MTNSKQSARFTRFSRRLMQGSALIGLAAAWASSASAQTVAAAAAPPTETVVGTGTSIRGAAPVGDNVMTVDRDTIEATGANSVQNLLTTVPAITGFGNPGQGSFGSADGSGTAGPTLHSLGAGVSDSTVILV